MADQTFYILFFGGLILSGYLSYFLSQKIKVSHITILIILGTIIGLILNSTNNLSIIDTTLLFAIAFLYLFMFTFDSASKPSIKHVDTTYTHAVRLFILNTLMHFFLITYIFVLTLKLDIFEASIFSLILTSTTATFFSKRDDKLSTILKNEKIIGLPILLMIVYAMYDNYAINYGIENIFGTPIKPYILEFIGGIGVGVLVSIVFFRTIRGFHKNRVSPLITFVVALTSYIITELIGCDGIVGLATFGLIYGNLHLEQKEKTLKFFEDSVFPIELIIILLTAILISPKIWLQMMLYSFILFLIIVGLRYIAVKLTFKGHGHTRKEEVYLTLNYQIGAPLIIILLLIMITNIQRLESASAITLLIIFFSSISSTIAQRIEEVHIKT